MVLQPYWFVNDFDGLTVSITHGSLWRYDMSVPIILPEMLWLPKLFSGKSRLSVLH
jgi:hypothetical protein